MTAAEFPDRVNPFLVKELRQGLRARIFEGIFLGVHVSIVIVVAFEVLASGFQRGAAPRLQELQWGAEIVFLCILLPLRAYASVRDELNADSIDLLRVANVDAARVINGKWQSQMLLVTILLVSFAPYHLLRYYIGKIEPLNEVIALACCWGVSALTTAFFLFYATMGLGGRIAWMIFGVPFGLWMMVALIGSVISIHGHANSIWTFLAVGSVFGFGGMMFFLTLAIGGFEERARMKRLTP